VRPSFSLAVLLGALLSLQPATAQTVVNSTFVGQFSNPYSDPNNWAPAEVPNNTETRSYNVTVPGLHGPTVNIDATISNLTSQARVFVDGHTLTVTGRTAPFLNAAPEIIVFSYADAPATFNAGTLAAFFDNTLRGRYTLFGAESPATLKFKGANVRTLSEGELVLFGALTQIVDEFGNDALDGLALVESSGSLVLDGRNLTTFEPFTNQGTLSVGQGGESTIFTAANSLTNFDAGTRTLSGGEFKVGAGLGPGAILPVELRFNGADIVNNGSKLAISGAGARIADLAGNDGLRNLAHNLPGASLTLHSHNLLTTIFRNDGSLSITESIFTVAGSFGNFDPSTRTLNGGAYVIVADGNLKFNGADIVHNGASIVLNFGGSITDLAGNNGLRNFSDNLAGAAFVAGLDQDFTAAPGDFTNAGRIETIGFEGGIPEFPATSGKMTVPPGFSYTQTAGTTVINGTLTADRVNIFGGSLVSDIGTINGNITVTDAAVFPGRHSVVNGEVTFNSGSVYHTIIDPLARVSAWRQIAGKVVVAGTLEVELPDPLFLGGSFYSFPILESNTSITGEFQNAPNGTRILTADGRGSFVVVYEPKRVLLTRFVAVPPPLQLLNISTRGVLSATNDDVFHTRSVLIGGFILTGTEAKTVALRGIGPSLSKFGLNPTLEDPVLELYDGPMIASNDNWKGEQQDAITQKGLAPGDDREAAVIVTLQPQHSYTVILKEKNGRPGYGLVEVYDLSTNSFSKLGNISTRGFTDSSNVLIGGVIIGGDGQANDEVIVRAIGPTMRRGGVLNALDDPTLELRDSNGGLLAFNDDWGTNFDQIPNDYRPPEKTESALRASLPRGHYTAIVRAKPNSGGVGLVEFYDLWR
jgi:hypothetical protein